MHRIPQEIPQGIPQEIGLPHPHNLPAIHLNPADETGVNSSSSTFACSWLFSSSSYIER